MTDILCITFYRWVDEQLKTEYFIIIDKNIWKLCATMEKPPLSFNWWSSWFLSEHIFVVLMKVFFCRVSICFVINLGFVYSDAQEFSGVYGVYFYIWTNVLFFGVLNLKWTVLETLSWSFRGCYRYLWLSLYLLSLLPKWFCLSSWSNYCVLIHKHWGHITFSSW